MVRAWLQFPVLGLAHLRQQRQSLIGITLAELFNVPLAGAAQN